MSLVEFASMNCVTVILPWSGWTKAWTGRLASAKVPSESLRSDAPGSVVELSSASLPSEFENSWKIPCGPFSTSRSEWPYPLRSVVSSPVGEPATLSGPFARGRYVYPPCDWSGDTAADAEDPAEKTASSAAIDTATRLLFKDLPFHGGIIATFRSRKPGIRPGLRLEAVVQRKDARPEDLPPAARSSSGEERLGSFD